MEGKRIALSLIFTTLVWVCNAQTAFDKKLQSLYKNSVPLIHASELNDLMGKNTQFLILDTRKPKEFTVSHLPKAVLIDYDHYKIEDLDRFDRKAKVIVYCSVGYRSERVGEKLLKLGFIDVHNLYGGIFEWKNEGYQVLNKTGRPTDSIHTYNKNWSQWLVRGVKVY